MNVYTQLTRKSVFGFGLFFGLAILAFWPSYFSRLLAQPSYHFHAHGLALTLWLALLVAQALLIRTRHRSLHKKLGRLSFLLAPFVVISTLHLLSFRLSPIPPSQLQDVAYYFVALIVNALVVFSILYFLAIKNRHDSAAHARYMICTVFPLFTPVTDRLIGAYLPSVVNFVPRIGGTPILPVAGFVLAEGILLALTLLDLRSQRQTYAFAIAFLLLLAYHVSVLTFHNVPAWQAFCRWFVQLPLS